MSESSASWVNTTHDWGTSVDREHLELVRRDPRRYAPGGVVHLVLEVLAYADDEAAALGRRGRAEVTLRADGSVVVGDDGRGTDTRRDGRGRVVRKPVMATKDLRFFDVAHQAVLPDGHPRRGISVVAASSTWLEHTNRRQDGAWTQRYDHGVPADDLTPVDLVQDVDTLGATGTTVAFLPAAGLTPTSGPAVTELLGAAPFSWLTVEVRSPGA